MFTTRSPATVYVMDEPTTGLHLSDIGTRMRWWTGWSAGETRSS